MSGAKGTLYEGEVFRLGLRFDVQYPIDPPEERVLHCPADHETNRVFVALVPERQSNRKHIARCLTSCAARFVRIRSNTSPSSASRLRRHSAHPSSRVRLPVHCDHSWQLLPSARLASCRFGARGTSRT
jgi:ubiquitin-protein ligase